MGRREKLRCKRITNRRSQRREGVSRRIGHLWPGVAALIVNSDMFDLAIAAEERHDLGAKPGYPCQFPFPTRLRSSVTFGLACLLAPLCVATAFADNNHASTNRLTAVWEAHANILATTFYGMFRASRAEKKWVQLTPPATMPIQGSFAPVPTNASYVVFVAVGGDSNKVAGIYLSQDEGSSWRLLSKQYGFTSAYVTENGTSMQ